MIDKDNVIKISFSWTWGHLVYPRFLSSGNRSKVIFSFLSHRSYFLMFCWLKPGGLCLWSLWGNGIRWWWNLGCCRRCCLLCFCANSDHRSSISGDILLCWGECWFRLFDSHTVFYTEFLLFWNRSVCIGRFRLQNVPLSQPSRTCFLTFHHKTGHYPWILQVLKNFFLCEVFNRWIMVYIFPRPPLKDLKIWCPSWTPYNLRSSLPVFSESAS